MFETFKERFGRWSAMNHVALFSVSLTATAVAAAQMVAEATFRLLSDVDVGHVRVAVLATAALVAAPVVTALVRAVFKARDERRELSTRAQLLSTAQEHAQQGQWEFDVLSGEIVLSEALNRLLGGGGGRGRLTMPRLLEMTNPADRDALEAALERVLKGGSQEQIEYRITAFDGRERRFWATGARLLGADGTVAKALGIAQDITDQRAMEAALRDSEDFYRHAVELSPHMPWVADAQGRQLEAPHQWQALTGLSPEECLGSGWTRALHPEDVEEALQAWEGPLRTGEPYFTEHRVRLVDGSYRWFRARASARRDDKGQIVRWYGTVEDIHERKTAVLALQESEAFANSILESTTNCIRVLDREGRLQYINKPGLAALEIDNFDSFLGLRWADCWPTETREQVERAISAARDGGQGRFTALGPTAKGTPKWWEVTASPIPGPDGRPARLLAISRDITEQKRAHDEMILAREAANTAAQLLRNVLESTTDCVINVDRDWRIQFANQRSMAVVPQLEGAMGRSLWEVFPESSTETMARQLRRALEDQTEAEFEEFSARLQMWMEVRAYPSAAGLSIFFRDVSAERQAMQELRYAARHDSLTGLLNRSCFREHLAKQIGGSSPDSRAAVLFLDLDEFKAINDDMGHPAGDQLLRKAAVRLQTCLRDTELIARLGGDEFAILQTNVLDTDHVESLAQRILRRLGEPYMLEGREVVVGTSLGIAVSTSADNDVDDLLKQADIALYQAKADGRGIYRFFEPGMDTVAKELQRLRSDLRAAVGRGEFRIHYQPVVEFETNRVLAFEALLRWQHPWRGLLQPADFISLAESSGAIEEIGAWVLQEACSRAVGWPDEVALSVNLSPRQFRGRCLLGAVTRSLARSGLAAHRLQLEITESVLLQDDAVVRRTLEGLRDLGVRISIDDFGTGYSSLGYLQRFSVDNIKIDRSFVVGLVDSERTSAILRALMGLGEDLGVSLTAEGIETVEQLEKLKEMGCRQGQGFLFARPMRDTDVASFVADGWIDPSDPEAAEMVRLAG